MPRRRTEATRLPALHNPKIRYPAKINGLLLGIVHRLSLAIDMVAGAEAMLFLCVLADGYPELAFFTCNCPCDEKGIALAIEVPFCSVPPKVGQLTRLISQTKFDTRRASDSREPDADGPCCTN